MNEEKALELYNFFNKEGYDLGDEQNFFNALSDETKRIELYDFFNEEGYDVGSIENFTLKKKEDPTTGLSSEDGSLERQEYEQDRQQLLESYPTLQGEERNIASLKLFGESADTYDRKQAEKQRSQRFRSDQDVRKSLGLEDVDQQETKKPDSFDYGGASIDIPQEGISVFDDRGRDIADPMRNAAREGKFTVAPSDVRSTDYVDPVELVSQGRFPSSEELKSAEEQRKLDLEFTKQKMSQEQPLLEQRLADEQIQQFTEQEMVRKERQEVIQSPEFDSLVSQISDSDIDMTEEEFVKEYNEKYGRYGFVFTKFRLGDAVLVTAKDGSSTLIDLQPFFDSTNTSESIKLKEFIEAKVSSPEDLYTDPDNLQMSVRANNLRRVPRINEDGSMSTVLMAAEKIDGKNVAFPTLFPTDPNNYSSDPRTWTEYSDPFEAYEVAKSRGEVFTFEEFDDALEFAEGSWKRYNDADAEANKFFAEKDLDYTSFKYHYDKYNDSYDELEFIESEPPLYLDELEKDQKEKFGDKYYINGVRRSDYNKDVEELERRIDDIETSIMLTEDYMEAREQFDIFSEKRRKEAAGDAIKSNFEAKKAVEEANQSAIDYFGVPVSELSSIVPADEYQAKAMETMITDYNLAVAKKEIASQKYELSETWLDNKFDKNLRSEFLGKVSGVTTAISKGYSRGKAMDEVLMTAFGITDIDDDASREEVSRAIVEYLMEAEQGGIGKAQYRFNTSRGFLGAVKAFQDNTLELALALAGESMSMMMPYGIKIVPSSVATGVVIGAASGAASSGGVGAGAGALSGAGWGFTSGMAATSLAMEYNNAVLEAITNQGYDIRDPESVSAALMDEVVWAEGREIGLKRGIPIAAVDFLAKGMAGRIFKVGKVATKTRKAAAFLGERLVFDPAMEALGETAAQVVAGQNLDSKEILAEAIGGFGNNASSAAVNMTIDAFKNNNVSIANDLMTIEGIAAETSSDKRIATWANNMERLGNITSEQNQRIQENIGLRREARETLGTDKRITRPLGRKNVALENRLMELLSAREDLSSTKNRKEVFAPKIREINDEIAEIVSSRTLRDADKQTNFPKPSGRGFVESDTRVGVGKYMVRGKVVSREKFLREVDRLTPRRLSKINPQVQNDEEVEAILKKKKDAIQKQETGVVPDAEQTTDTQEVEAEVRVTPEEEVAVEEEVTEEDLAIGRQEVLDVSEGTTTTTKPVKIFKGIGGKKDLKGYRINAHKGADGVFGTTESAIAEQYGKDEGVAETTLPVGTTVEVIEIDPKGKTVSEFRAAEVEAINNSKAQVVKLVTLDGRIPAGQKRNVQFIIKDKAILETLKTEQEVEVDEDTKAALAEETKDFEAMLLEGVDTEEDTSSDPQFQIESVESDKKRKKKLVDKAIQLMEELQPLLEGEALTVEESATARTFIIDVKENTELADKVRKMGLDELVGKRINLVMADQLKVDEERMGGNFFPLIDGLFGEVAWASISREAAESIAKGSIKADYSVVYNMSPSAVDSNIVLLNTMFDKVRESDNPEKLFEAIKTHLLGLSFGKNGKKTKEVHEIAKESKNIEEFSDRYQKLDVDTRAEIFKKILPSRDVDAKTEVGKIFEKQGVSQESIREENVEQFVSDLPMGAMTMVLKITDKNGNPVTIDTYREAVISPEEQKERGLREHRNYPFYLRGRAVAMLSETTPFWNVNKRYRDSIDLKIQGTIKQKEKYIIDYNGKKRVVKVSNNPNGTRTVDLLKPNGKDVAESFVIPKSTKTATKTIIKKKLGDVLEISNIDEDFTASQARSAAMRSASMSASSSFEVESPTATMYEKFVRRISKAFPNVEVMTDQESFDNLVKNLNAKKLLTKQGEVGYSIAPKKRRTSKVYGAVYEGKLYLNPSLENYNTPIHEFGHIWSNVAKEMNPEAYARGIELVKGSDYVSKIKNDLAYQKIVKDMRKNGASEQEINTYILEEALATAIGDKGESFANAAQKRNFKSWLNELFEFVKKLTGISKMSSEQLQDINFDEFLQGVVVDLMSENELFAEAETKALSDSLQLMTSSSTQSMQSIIQTGRAYGFSDASIVEVLKKRGFKVKDINDAMEVKIDLLTELPVEFRRVDGGVSEALKLFNDVRAKLSKFAAGKKVNGELVRPSISEVRQKAMDLMKAHPVYQSQNDQIQMELLSGFDKTLQTRANVSVQKEISQIRRNLRQRKIGAKNLKQAQITLKNFIRKNLPKSNMYSQAQINRLVNAVSNTNLDNFEAQAEKVISIVEEQRAKIKKSVIKQIKGLVAKKAKVRKTSTGKVRSKGLDAKGQAIFKQFDVILKHVLMEDTEALSRIRAVLSQNASLIDDAFVKENEGQKLTQEERRLMNTQIAFETFSELESMTLEDTEALLEAIKNINAESMLRLKNRREFKANIRAMDSEAMNDQIRETNPELFDEDGDVLSVEQRKERRKKIHEMFRNKQYPKAIKQWISNYKYSTTAQLIATAKNNFRHLGTLMNLLDRVNDGKTMFTDMVYRRLNRMDEVYLSNKFETQSKIDSMAKQFGFDKGYKGVKRKLSEIGITKLQLIDSRGKKYTATLSADQLMRIYALSLNDVQRAKLERQGINDQVLGEIQNTLGADLVSFADVTVDFLSNEYYNKVNDVYAQVNDVNLGYVSNYFPTRTISPDADKQLLDNGDFSGIFNAETAPAFKERTDVNNPVDLDSSDFTSALDSHIDTMEKYTAYAYGTKRLNDFFKIESVDVLLEELGIKGAVKASINMVINPMSGYNASQSNKVIEFLQRKFTGFALSFKLIQIPKQASSFVNAYADYSYFPENSRVPKVFKSAIDIPMFMLDGAATILSMGKDLVGKKGALSEAMEMSASFKNRVRQGLEGDVYGLESGSKTFKKVGNDETRRSRIFRGLKAAAGSPTVVGDIMGVMGYMINYKRNIKNGMSKADAVEAFNNYNATQQTRRGTEKIPLQNNNSALVRSFTMFGSTLFLQMNKAMSSMTNVMRAISTGKMPRKQDMREFILNTSVANGLFAAMGSIAMLTQGKSDDEDRAMRKIYEAMSGLNLLYQLPFLGAEIEKADLINRMIDGDSYRKPFSKNFSSPVVNPFSSIMFKMSKITKADETFDSRIRPIAELVLGTQLDPFIGLFNMFSGQEDFEENMYDILGISKSYRPGGGESGGKKKSPKNEMSKSDMKKYFPDMYNDIYGGTDEVEQEMKKMRQEILDSMNE
jgi:hypothetical protein